MDEDELLYREMNEDDPYYMGDRKEDKPARSGSLTKKQSRRDDKTQNK